MENYSSFLILLVVSFCLVMIFGAGTCLIEEIFQKNKSIHRNLLGEIWKKIIFLFFGIITTLIVPLLLINKLYDLEISLFFPLSRETYFYAYYSVCVLIWVLIFLASWRHGGKKIR
ncbi:MAG: hypothetical protein WC682_03025 [Parcubacteria group bacterium]